MKILSRHNAWLAMLMLAATPAVRAQSIPEAGRALLRKHEHSLWTVEIQIRQTLVANGQTGKQEGKVTTQGFLTDVGNLIAIPLSALEPANLMRASNPQAQAMKISSEVVDVKLLIPEGGDVPATVVFRDNDLDLAFVAPREALPANATPIRLGDAGKPGVLDTAIMIARLENVGRGALIVNAGYIQAVLDKPQAAYLFELANMSSAGCPVFMPDGKFIGAVLMRFTTNVQADGRETVAALALVQPAESIRAAAKQAEEAAKKADLKKDDVKKNDAQPK